MWRPVQVAAIFRPTVSLCGLVFQVQKSNAQIGASDLVLQGLEKLDYRTADTSIVRPWLYLAFILVSVVQLTPDVTVYCQQNCSAYITAYNSSLCRVLKNSYIILYICQRPV